MAAATASTTSRYWASSSIPDSPGLPMQTRSAPAASARAAAAPGPASAATAAMSTASVTITASVRARSRPSAAASSVTGVCPHSGTTTCAVITAATPAAKAVANGAA